MPQLDFEQVDRDVTSGMEQEFYDPAIEITVNDLPKVLRIMRSISRNLEVIGQYEKDEIRRVRGMVANKVIPLEERLAFFREAAERLLRETGKDRIEYPGLGVVRWGKTREKVNTDKWDNMTTEEQATFAQTCPTYFRTKLEPEKKAIFKVLGVQPAPPLSDIFSVEPKRELFVFKPED